MGSPAARASSYSFQRSSNHSSCGLENAKTGPFDLRTRVVRKCHAYESSNEASSSVMKSHSGPRSDLQFPSVVRAVIYDLFFRRIVGYGERMIRSTIDAVSGFVIHASMSRLMTRFACSCDLEAARHAAPGFDSATSECSSAIRSVFPHPVPQLTIASLVRPSRTSRSRRTRACAGCGCQPRRTVAAATGSDLIRPRPASSVARSAGAIPCGIQKSAGRTGAA